MAGAAYVMRDDIRATPEMTDFANLVQRVRHLEDLEAIRLLKATYCLYCDRGWPQQGGSHCGPIADLFAEDGVWDGSPGLPIAEGREAIRALFETLKAIPFAYHVAANPMITIDGDRAVGHWHLVGAGSMPGGHSGFFLGGYEERYVRTDAGWRFKELRNFQARQASMPDGWGDAPGNESWAPKIVF